jgi:hypothetical protein
MSSSHRTYREVFLLHAPYDRTHQRDAKHPGRVTIGGVQQNIVEYDIVDLEARSPFDVVETGEVVC